MTIQERIKQVRKEKGWTQTDLGNRLNVRQSMVGQYESNKQPPKIPTLKKIADALGVTLEWLVTGEEDFIAEPITMSVSMQGSAHGTTTQAIIAEAKASIDRDFQKLNLIGAQEAAKRLHELTRIDEYIK